METINIACNQEENGFSGEVLEFPGCFTQGNTWEEFEANLVSALACHLDCEEDQIEGSYKFSFVLE